ncbi:MAG: hypothetical protein J0H60_11605 [Rhizobiales bacterium]|nr:hypothetical protein [Hyphomicrobiales bacterium]
MKLFEVEIDRPVKRSTYFVVADGYDAAEEIAQLNETKDGGRNGGVLSIKDHGDVEGEDRILLLPAGLGFCA